MGSKLRTFSMVVLLLLGGGMGAKYLLGLFDEEPIAPEPLSLSELPLRVPDSLIKPLRELENPRLQHILDDVVNKNPKWKRLVANKKLGIGLVDMRNPYAVKFAHKNGDNMMYAASLPKIAVLLTAVDAMEKGDLEETPELQQDLRQMIAKSNNASTTKVIDIVGLDRIQKVMQDPRYEFYDQEKGGGLWVGKRYASTGPRRGDPMKNISHAASPTQVCRYYYLLAFGQLVTFDRSKEMLGYLGNPELHHKFVNTMDQVAPKAKVFRKSGSWKDFHADSALIWGPDWRRYIIVAMCEDGEGEKLMRALSKEIDRRLKPV